MRNTRPVASGRLSKPLTLRSPLPKQTPHTLTPLLWHWGHSTNSYVELARFLLSTRHRPVPPHISHGTTPVPTHSLHLSSALAPAQHKLSCYRIQLSQMQLSQTLTTNTQMAWSARSKHKTLKHILCRISRLYSGSHSCKDFAQHDDDVVDASCSAVETV